MTERRSPVGGDPTRPARPRPSVLRGVVAAAGFAFFVYCTVVQHNDPDAGVWLVTYGLTAVLFALGVVGVGPRWPAGVLGGVCVLWAAWLSTHGGFSGPVLVTEEGREMLGLLVAAVALGGAVGLRPARPAAGAPPASTDAAGRP